jgi:hypothetical protein
MTTKLLQFAALSALLTLSFQGVPSLAAASHENSVPHAAASPSINKVDTTISTHKTSTHASSAEDGLKTNSETTEEKAALSETASMKESAGMKENERPFMMEKDCMKDACMKKMSKKPMQGSKMTEKSLKPASSSTEYQYESKTQSKKMDATMDSKLHN